MWVRNSVLNRAFKTILQTRKVSTSSKMPTVSASCCSGLTPRSPLVIAVEGNIGAGKTTFLQEFIPDQETNLVQVFPEPVNKWRDLHGDNLLGLMYEDSKRWSFLLQSYIQLTMLQQHLKPSSAKIKLLERSLLSARYCFVENLYSKGLMSNAEHAVLSEWFNFIISCPEWGSAVKTDLIVYLRTDPEVAYQRILDRHRNEECKIPFDYVKDLHELHEDWLVRKTKFQPLQAQVLVVDANDDLSSLTPKYNELRKEIIKLANSDSNDCNDLVGSF